MSERISRFVPNAEYTVRTATPASPAIASMLVEP